MSNPSNDVKTPKLDQDNQKQLHEWLNHNNAPLSAFFETFNAQGSDTNQIKNLKPRGLFKQNQTLELNLEQEQEQEQEQELEIAVTFNQNLSNVEEAVGSYEYQTLSYPIGNDSSEMQVKIDFFQAKDCYHLTQADQESYRNLSCISANVVKISSAASAQMKKHEAFWKNGFDADSLPEGFFIKPLVVNNLRQEYCLCYDANLENQPQYAAQLQTYIAENGKNCYFGRPYQLKTESIQPVETPLITTAQLKARAELFNQKILEKTNVRFDLVGELEALGLLNEHVNVAVYNLLSKAENEQALYVLLAYLKKIKTLQPIKFNHLKECFLEPRDNWEHLITLETLEIFEKINSLPDDQFRWWQQCAKNHVNQMSSFDCDLPAMFSTFQAFIQALGNFWHHVYGEEEELVLPTDQLNTLPIENLFVDLDRVFKILRTSCDPKGQLSNLVKQPNLSLTQYFYTCNGQLQRGKSLFLSASAGNLKYVPAALSTNVVDYLTSGVSKPTHWELPKLESHKQKHLLINFLQIFYSADEKTQKVSCGYLEQEVVDFAEKLSKLLLAQQKENNVNISNDVVLSLMRKSADFLRLGIQPQEILQFIDRLTKSRVPKVFDAFFNSQHLDFLAIQTKHGNRLCSVELLEDVYQKMEANDTERTLSAKYGNQLGEGRILILNCLYRELLKSDLNGDSNFLENVLKILICSQDLFAQLFSQQEGFELRQQKGEIIAFDSPEFTKLLARNELDVEEINRQKSNVIAMSSVSFLEGRQLFRKNAKIVDFYNHYAAISESLKGLSPDLVRRIAIVLSTMQVNPYQPLSFAETDELLAAVNQTQNDIKLTDDVYEQLENKVKQILEKRALQKQVTVDFSLNTDKLVDLNKQVTFKNTDVAHLFVPEIVNLLKQFGVINENVSTLTLQDLKDLALSDQIQNHQMAKSFFSKTQYATTDEEQLAEAVIDSIEKLSNNFLVTSVVSVNKIICNAADQSFQKLRSTLEKLALEVNPIILEISKETGFQFNEERTINQYTPNAKTNLLGNFKTLLSYNELLGKYLEEVFQYSNTHPKVNGVLAQILQKTGNLTLCLNSVSSILKVYNKGVSNFPTLEKALVNLGEMDALNDEKLVLWENLIRQWQYLPAWSRMEDAVALLTMIKNGDIDKSGLDNVLSVLQRLYQQENTVQLATFAIGLLQKEREVIGETLEKLQRLFQDQAILEIAEVLLKRHGEAKMVYELISVLQKENGLLKDILLKALSQDSYAIDISHVNLFVNNIDMLKGLEEKSLAAIQALYDNVPCPNFEQLNKLLINTTKDKTVENAVAEFERDPYQDHREYEVGKEAYIITQQKFYDQIRVKPFLNQLQKDNPELFGTKRDTQFLQDIEKDVAYVMQYAQETASRLTKKQLSDKLIAIQQQLAETGEIKERYLLKLEALACLTEVIYRTTGHTPNSTQIIDVILQTKFNRGLGLQINTGEGKSYISRLLGGMRWIDGYAVNMFTSNPHLSKRDFEESKNFWRYFGVQPEYIDKASSFNINYQAKQVYYSTTSDYALWKAACIDKKNEDPTKNVKKAGIFDEADQIFYNVSTKSNYSTAWSLIKANQRKQFYQKINEYFDEHSSEFLKAEEKSLSDLLLTHAYALRGKLQAVLGQELVKQLDDQMLIDWLDSARMAADFVRSNNVYPRYTVTETKDSRTGKYKKTIKVLNDEQHVIEGAAFSGGVHQLLAARLQIEQPDDLPYEIKAENKIVDTTADWNVVRSMDWYCGITGTFGSEELRKQSKEAGITILNTAPHNVDLKQLRDTVFAADQEKHHYALYKNLLRPLKLQRNQKHGARLLIRNTEAKCKVSVHALLGQLQKDNKGPLTILQVVGDQYLQFRVDQMGHYLQQTGEIISKQDFDRLATKTETVIVATQAMGRGVDIKNLEQVIIGDYFIDEKIEGQIKGRTGRYGAFGEIVPIYNWQEISQEYGQAITANERTGVYSWSFLGKKIAFTNRRRLSILKRIREEYEQKEAALNITHRAFSEQTRLIQDLFDETIIRITDPKKSVLITLKTKLVQSFNEMKKTNEVEEDIQRYLMEERQQYPEVQAELDHLLTQFGSTLPKADAKFLEGVMLNGSYKHYNINEILQRITKVMSQISEATTMISNNQQSYIDIDNILKITANILHVQRDNDHFVEIKKIQCEFYNLVYGQTCFQFDQTNMQNKHTPFQIKDKELPLLQEMLMVKGTKLEDIQKEIMDWCENFDIKSDELLHQVASLAKGLTTGNLRIDAQLSWYNAQNARAFEFLVKQVRVKLLDRLGLACVNATQEEKERLEGVVSELDADGTYKKVVHIVQQIGNLAKDPTKILKETVKEINNALKELKGKCAAKIIETLNEQLTQVIAPIANETNNPQMKI